MVEPIFSPAHVETLKPYIKKTVDGLLSALINEGCSEPVDLIEKFALPVPSYVSSRPRYFRSGGGWGGKRGFPGLGRKEKRKEKRKEGGQALTLNSRNTDHLHHPRRTLQRPRVPHHEERHPHKRKFHRLRGAVRKRVTFTPICKYLPE